MLTAALVWRTVGEGAVLGLVAGLVYWVLDKLCAVTGIEQKIAELPTLRAAVAQAAEILVIDADPDGDMIQPRHRRGAHLEWAEDAPELASYLGEREEWEGLRNG